MIVIVIPLSTYPSTEVVFSSRSVVDISSRLSSAGSKRKLHSSYRCCIDLIVTPGVLTAIAVLVLNLQERKIIF